MCNLLFSCCSCAYGERINGARSTASFESASWRRCVNTGWGWWRLTFFWLLYSFSAPPVQDLLRPLQCGICYKMMSNAQQCPKCRMAVGGRACVLKWFIAESKPTCANSVRVPSAHRLFLFQCKLDVRRRVACATRKYWIQ